MRILYISPRPPFPPEGRETVRPYHQIRFMALRHDIDLICFSGGGVDEWAARERLSKLCHRVQIIPIETPPQQPASVRNLFSRRPLALRRFYRKELMRRLRSIAETGRYDLVFISSAAMAPYAAAFPETPKILDLVDVGSLRWMEYANLSRFPASAVYRAESLRLMHTELKGAEEVQRVILSSRDEAEVFRGVCSDHEGVEALKTPVNPRAPLSGPWSADPTILFTGNLDHFPNADAAVHLMKDIFPRVKALSRNVRLVIAGKNPPDEIRTMADRADVTLVTRQAGLRDIFRDAWLVVAPHRVARGVRNEILEAMALGVPVVATEAAYTGLDLLPGRDLVVEAHPARFAAEIVRLLEDPRKLDEIGEQGRKSVHNNYSHWSVAIRLEEILNAAVSEPVKPVTPA